MLMSIISPRPGLPVRLFVAVSQRSLDFRRIAFRHCKITRKTKANIQKNHVMQASHEAHEEPPVIRTKHTKHGHKKSTK